MQADTNGLQAEIGLARALLSDLIDQSDRRAQTHTIVKLMDALAHLQKAELDRQTRLALLLPRATIEKLARAIVAAVAEELSVVPGWEDILDRLAARLASVIAETTTKET